ncbi:MAG: hypothetical protein AAFN50_05660, partial [Pseudomonadota bacterium]
VYDGDVVIAGGSLGSAGVMLLPEGEYRVVLQSTPAVETMVRLAPRDGVKLMFEKRDARISPFEQREELPYTACRLAN